MKQNPDAPSIHRPWYREPWPWVAIGIPAVAILMGLTTLYLALANPDYLVVDEQQYNVIKSELRAQDTAPIQEDGEH